MAEHEATEPQPEARHSEPLTFKYANTVQYISGLWDLKMVFGDAHVDLTTGEAIHRPHTGITLSWEQAKVALMFFLINVAVYEKDRGEIKIPKLAFSPELQERISKPYLSFEEAMRMIRETFGVAVPGD